MNQPNLKNLVIGVSSLIISGVFPTFAQTEEQESSSKEDRTAVAFWKFDGNLRDDSDWGRELTVEDPCFVPGHHGQALKSGHEYVEVQSRPELELAPGLLIDCWVNFSQQPTGYNHFVGKEDEYMLRVDPPSEGNQFAFFVKLNGSWEPRVRCGEAVKPDLWYHVIAQWDGKQITLEVNGKKESVRRSGSIMPTDEPLEIGAFDGMIDELRIENPAMQNPRAKAAELLVADWKFDDRLEDSSGRGHDITLNEPHFTAGNNGKALMFGSESALTPDSPDLELAPGLRIECWVYFDKKSTGFRNIVSKDREYLLRVDSLDEGGRFSFFVHQGKSWGQRVQYSKPMELGRWYHLIAFWDGDVATLDVNGETSRVRRPGKASHGSAPLKIGSDGVRIDDLRIGNPTSLAMQELRSLLTVTTANQKNSPDHFGQDTGWPGWSGAGGAQVSSTGEKLHAELADSNAMIVNPGFDLDLAQYKYVCCDISCNIAHAAQLIFIMDSGHGTVQIPVWQGARTSVANLTDVPEWQGRLKLLAISIPGIRTHQVQLENLWICSKPMGKPFLQVRNFAQDRALLHVGRPEKVTAVIHNLGIEAKEATARLVLPKGAKCISDSVYTLGFMSTDAVKNAEWTITADSEINELAEVVLTTENGISSSERYRLIFRPADAPPEIKVHTKEKDGTITYYIDSIDGDNTNTGRSIGSPWKDFTNINGKTLGPGEKLLIKRGSIINQELQLSAHGTADNWAEIGTYGNGARPIIRRNWDIQDRCALISSPDYLWIHGLMVSCAAQGLIVYYSKSGHTGLVIEDCIASHIEGLYYPDNHGIPEWRGQPGPQGGASRSAGIGVTGASAEDVIIRNCEMFHTSQGFRVSQQSKRSTIDRVFCHDCYAHNTSPHPILIGGTLVQNSIFDASGGHASRGTMGIMLGSPQGLTFRNCIFRNMPDSGSYDQGGVDFEAGGDGCLIDGCTFENNAGAGIEVLGLKSPQCKNIEIRKSRFIRNNWVKKSHGPAEIYVWGKEQNPDPVVCCSSGSIHDNGYVLLPGVEFFINAVPQLTWWTLQNNVQYTTPGELRAAMPHNEPPVVKAGPDLCSNGSTVQLNGKVSDDGKPAGSSLTTHWEVLEGPGNVAFKNDSDPASEAIFSKPGDYLLRLSGDDGELWFSDMVAVHVLPPGTTVSKAWEFNQQLEKQGWTEVNLGTTRRKMGSKSYNIADPVKYVGGGYYIVVVEDSTDAHLLSPDNLAVDLNKNKTITIRFQNHTPATQMRFAFTTTASSEWNDTNCKSFDVIANDNQPRMYTLDMSDVIGWKDDLRQLRLDLAMEKPITGTCRIDYIWIGSASAK